MLIVLSLLFITNCSKNAANTRAIDAPFELVGEPSMIHIVVDAEEKIIEPGTNEYDEIVDLLESRFGEDLQTA